METICVKTDGFVGSSLLKKSNSPYNPRKVTKGTRSLLLSCPRPVLPSHALWVLDKLPFSS